jgi:broad specificity phosphatase PhoE
LSLFSSSFIHVRLYTLRRPLSLRSFAQESLRERSFGTLDLLEDDVNYERVWAADDAAENASGGLLEEGVESVLSVQDRSTRFIVEELEEDHVDDLIVLVGHGDLLQILQTGFQQIDPRLHRTLPHMSQCEFRSLELTPPTLKYK